MQEIRGEPETEQQIESNPEKPVEHHVDAALLLCLADAEIRNGVVGYFEFWKSKFINGSAPATLQTSGMYCFNTGSMT
jgi:hypothetical protein